MQGGLDFINSFYTKDPLSHLLLGLDRPAIEFIHVYVPTFSDSLYRSGPCVV
jgi:hypothetical protein